MFSFMLIDPEQVRNQVNYALRVSFTDFVLSLLQIHTRSSSIAKRISYEIRFQMFFS